MRISGELIRLDPQEEGVSYEPEDWDLVEGRRMRHMLSGCIFDIGCDDEAIQNGEATLFQFSARLVHVCAHRKIPSAETELKLGRAAIAVFLQAIGAWKPMVRNVPDRRACRHRKPWTP